MNMNILQLPLRHFICFTLLLLLPPAFSSGLIPKPGCPDRCGNVSIRFPFGVGSDCSFGHYFNINCNTSTSTAPTPYLSYNEQEVVEINPSQIRVRINGLLDKACYNKSGQLPDEWMYYPMISFMFYGTPFAFSDENWLTVIGCDDLATIFTTDDEGFQQDIPKFGSSCVSFCSNMNGSNDIGFCPDSDSGYSPSKGCCVTNIPQGITHLSVKLSDLAKEWRVEEEKLFSCSFAFIQEKLAPNQSKFSYPLSSLNNPNELFDENWPGKWKTRAPPVIRLDWRINEANCSQARRNATSYACRDNSVCIDYNATNTVGGYLCRCKQGYEGNPYVTGGCQDIDECADNPCAPNSDCINTPGSFNCSCRRGYVGDGRRSRSGCTKLPKSNILRTVLIGMASGLGFLLLPSICIVLHTLLQKRRIKILKEKFFKRNGGLLLQQTNEGTIQKTKLFSAEELEKATDNFNESRIVGKGGQGTVYQGMLSDGNLVAIKKSKVVNEGQLKQFINEVAILSNINHRHVIKLWGCCLETEVPLLVYEFVPNGTVFDLIHDPINEFPVPWNMRLKIAADLAGALAYLHSASSIAIYHRDIKSSNFLLDKKFVAKVADFGISKFVEEDQTHLTTKVKGTFGYCDPEYFQSHQYTEKSDVYSFGVVLAELLTGKKPIFRETSEEVEIGLATYFLTTMEENNLKDILDPQVSEFDKKDEVIAAARLAERCLSRERKSRPTMKEVSAELETLRISQIPATVNEESEDSTDEENEDATEYESHHMMISDTQYAWTTSAVRETSPTSSEINPRMFETV